MNLMEDLKAYLDGELSPERRAEIEAALSRDERLRQEMEEIRVLSRLIGDCVIEPEPVGLDATLATLAKTKPRPLFARVLRNPLRYGWAFALCGFVILAICFPLFQQAASSAKNMVAMDVGNSAAMPTESKAKAEIDKLPGDSRAQNGAGFISEGSAGIHLDGQVPGGAGGGKSPERNGDFTMGMPQAPSLKGRPGSTATPPDQIGNDRQRYGAVVDSPHIADQSNADAKVMSGGTFARGLAQPMLIRSGDFAIEVPKVQAAQMQVTTLAKRMKGYVEQSQTSAPTQGLPTAYLTMRVPVSKFDPTVAELRTIGKVLAESTNGQDVTAQVVDTEARLKAKRAEEQGYVEMMKGARKVPDMLEIRDRLGSVREEIESMEAERKSLREQAAYSTISVTLSQPIPKKPAAKPPVNPSWFDSSWRGASDRATSLGRWLAEVVMNLFVLAPAWVPIVVGLWWIGRRARLR